MIYSHSVAGSEDAVEISRPLELKVSPPEGQYVVLDRAPLDITDPEPVSHACKSTYTEYSIIQRKYHYSWVLLYSQIVPRVVTFTGSAKFGAYVTCHSIITWRVYELFHRQRNRVVMSRSCILICETVQQNLVQYPTAHMRQWVVSNTGPPRMIFFQWISTNQCASSSAGTFNPALCMCKWRWWAGESIEYQALRGNWESQPSLALQVRYIFLAQGNSGGSPRMLSVSKRHH